MSKKSIEKERKEREEFEKKRDEGIKNFNSQLECRRKEALERYKTLPQIHKDFIKYCLQNEIYIDGCNCCGSPRVRIFNTEEESDYNEFFLLTLAMIKEIDEEIIGE